MSYACVSGMHKDKEDYQGFCYFYRRILSSFQLGYEPTMPHRI